MVTHRASSRKKKRKVFWYRALLSGLGTLRRLYSKFASEQMWKQRRQPVLLGTFDELLHYSSCMLPLVSCLFEMNLDFRWVSNVMLLV
jgi:hypothetical protein